MLTFSNWFFILFALKKRCLMRMKALNSVGPVDWVGCLQNLCRRVRPHPQQVAQSAEAVEYTDYISADGEDSPNKCLGYDTEQSDS